MRNYYDALGLNRSATQLEVDQQINSLSPEQLLDEDDLELIMQNDEWQSHYQRVHLQYEAIAAAMNGPAMKGALNSHSWDKRVVEFSPAQDTLEF